MALTSAYWAARISVVILLVGKGKGQGIQDSALALFFYAVVV